MSLIKRMSPDEKKESGVIILCLMFRYNFKSLSPKLVVLLLFFIVYLFILLLNFRVLFNLIV